MSPRPRPSTYTVSGMTCEHCSRAVLEEVTAVPGVESADVDLEGGRLVVVGDADPSEIAGAVREAGYEVTP
jgi:copper chaperone